MFHFFGWVFSVVGLLVTVAAGIFAFGLAREYVRNRLRFVDAVRHPIAPWVAAFLVTVVLMPVVALLHVVHLAGMGTAPDCRWCDGTRHGQRRQGAQAGGIARG